MWKVKITTSRLKWKQYKCHFKDNLFGSLIPVIISVDKDWVTYQGKYSKIKIRDITYRMKRSKLPFIYFKVYRGTQCNDKLARPFARKPHESIIKLNDTIGDLNVEIKASNEKYEEHQNLRANIVNHKFKEYDHDYK